MHARVAVQQDAPVGATPIVGPFLRTLASLLVHEHVYAVDDLHQPTLGQSADFVGATRLLGDPGHPFCVSSQKGVRSSVDVHVGALQELKQVSFARIGAQ